MFWRARSFWIAAGATAYVAFAALGERDGHGAPWLALAVLPVLLAVGWTLTAPPMRGEDRVDPTARSAARAALTGLCVLLAAASAPSATAFDALTHVGAGLASMAGLVALARLESLGGLLEPPSGARRLDAAAFSALLWTVAIALPAAIAIQPGRGQALDPRLLDATAVLASIGSLVVTIVAAVRVRATRRLELGVAERASATLLLSIVALATGVAAALLSVLPPEHLFPIVAAIVGAVACWAAISAEATTVARALRIILTLCLATVPIALAAVYVAQVLPLRTGVVICVAAAAAAVAGLVTTALSHHLGPEGERWLRALDAATEAAMNPDPDTALESALSHLGGSSGRRFISPSLYRVAAADVMTVDRAGFVHTKSTDLPTRLVDLAEEEPEGVLRYEVLEAMQVRRPDFRPLLVWLEERDIGAAAVVRDSSGVIGMLAISRGKRRTPLTLEEVRAMRRLADRLGAVLGVAASLTRSRARELEAREQTESLQNRIDALRGERRADARRLDLLARTLERPARIATFSPAARTATEELERVGAAMQTVTLLTAAGVDPVAWAAVAHLASPHRGGVLLVVDGTDTETHSLRHWRDSETSPVAAAEGGSLVLLDPQCLPPEVQSYLGTALPKTLGIVVAVPATIDSLVAAGSLDERLADRLGDRAIALPKLIDRGEDLRGLALDLLVRIGMRTRGRPMALDLAALAALGEHSWPGNDAELESVLVRAAQVAKGDTVGRAELEAIGFSAPSEAKRGTPRTVGSLASPARRRGRRGHRAT